MPNVRISAAADPGTLLATDKLPLARAGDTNAYSATMAEISAFSSVSVASGAYGNVGRNKLHNPQFLVTQRGTGPWTAQGYTADRWYWQFITTGGSSSVVVNAISAATAAPVDEAMQNVISCTTTAGTGAGDISALIQNIENVRRLSGKTVTVSFWAWAAIGTPKIGIELSQFFGTGGSPSATVTAIGATAVTISATPTRYTATIAVPSAAGKTFGTTVGTDYTGVNLWLSSGATNAARASNIGFQSGTFNFWGVQLEIGSAATPLEKLEYAEQVLDCVRFYQGGYVNQYSYGGAGFGYDTTVYFSPPMRIIPTVTLSGITLTNLPSISPVATGLFFTVIGGTATATAATGFATNWVASADL